MRIGAFLGAAVSLLLAASAAAAAAATPPSMAPGSTPDGYPPHTHYETSCANKCDSGRGGNAITHVVFLASEGGKDATISHFQFDSGVSTHYFAADDGSVSDFVPEADTAYYAGDYPYNQTSIGVVVEGFVSTPSSFGDLDYALAAQLTAAIAHRYAIPIDAAHVLGRGDISTSVFAGQGPDPAFDLDRLRSVAQAFLDELEPPAITSPAPPPASAGQPYSYQYAASETSIEFSVSAGSLPDGLSLGTDGTLTGTPSKGGSFSYTVTAARPSGVTVSRTDTIDVAAARATLNPASLQFGTVALGRTATAQSAILSNNGDAQMIVSAVTIHGPQAGEFKQTADGCSGHTVPPASSCTVTVTFSPSAAGARVATLSFSDNAAGGVQDVALSGAGIAPYSAKPIKTTSDGTVTVALTPHVAGTATLTVTVPTGSIATGCRVARPCHPATTIVGVARARGRPGTTLVLTIKPRGKVRTALARGRALHALARLAYLPAGGGHKSITTRHLTLKRRP